MLDQWAVFLKVLWVPPEKHYTVYDIFLLIDKVEAVNAWIQAQSQNQTTIPVDLLQLIKTEFNEIFCQVLTSAMPYK